MTVPFHRMLPLLLLVPSILLQSIPGEHVIVGTEASFFAFDLQFAPVRTSFT
jgi:hypothetical protein